MKSDWIGSAPSVCLPIPIVLQLNGSYMEQQQWRKLPQRCESKAYLQRTDFMKKAGTQSTSQRIKESEILTIPVWVIGIKNPSGKWMEQFFREETLESNDKEVTMWSVATVSIIQKLMGWLWWNLFLHDIERRSLAIPTWVVEVVMIECWSYCYKLD